MNANNATTNVLHHIGLINPDLSVLTAIYENLGFTLTPVSLPKIIISRNEAPVTLGVGNRCAIFRNNYLELLGIVDAGQWASITTEQRGPFDIDRPLNRYAGLHVMHLGTDHIEDVKHRLDAQGTLCSGIMNFQRNVSTPEGQQTMHARSIGFPVNANPEALIQIAQHDTPELIFQPQFMSHENGACDILSIVICVTEPDKFAKKYEDYTGHRPVDSGKNMISLDLGLSTIIITGPDAFMKLIPDLSPPVLPFLGAFTVFTISLLHTRQFLLKKQIPFSDNGNTIFVDRSYAGGSALIFTEKRL